MSNLAPPPTYAPLLVQTQHGGENSINPVWLEWFLQYGSTGNAANGFLTGSYADVTGSRAINTYIPNQTGHLLFVSVYANVSPSPSLISAVSLNVKRTLTSPAKAIATISNLDTTVALPAAIFGAVPSGWYYEVDLQGTLYSWLEL